MGGDEDRQGASKQDGPGDDATNQGASAPEPAEGADDKPGGGAGSPEG